MNPHFSKSFIDPFVVLKSPSMINWTRKYHPTDLLISQNQNPMSQTIVTNRDGCLSTWNDWFYFSMVFAPLDSTSAIHLIPDLDLPPSAHQQLDQHEIIWPIFPKNESNCQTGESEARPLKIHKTSLTTTLWND